MAGLEPVGVAVAPHVCGQWGWRVLRRPQKHKRGDWSGVEPHVTDPADLAALLVGWARDQLAPSMVVPAVAGLAPEDHHACGVDTGVDDDPAVAPVRTKAAELAQRALATLRTKDHLTTGDVDLLDGAPGRAEGTGPLVFAVYGVSDADGADWAWVHGAGWCASGSAQDADARAVSARAIASALEAAPSKVTMHAGDPVLVHSDDAEAAWAAEALLTGVAPATVVQRYPWLGEDLAQSLAAHRGRTVRLECVESESTPLLVAAMDLCDDAVDAEVADPSRQDPSEAAVAAEQSVLSVHDTHPHGRGLAGAPGRIPLREHQQRAATALVNAWRTGDRAQVVAPCGSGKTLTFIAAMQAHDACRVLVVVPNLDLVAQVASAWVSHLGHVLGQVIGVCSEHEAIAHAASEALDMMSTLQARVVCTPEDLATLATSAGPTVVVATYQSLHVLTRAHHDHHLPTWDGLVVDEAHRSAGELSRPWAVVHDDARLPARVRVYGTATPQRVRSRDGTPVASMDDPKIFGDVADRVTLAEAIENKILCDYQLVGAIVHHEDVAQAITGRTSLHLDGHTLSADLLAAQVAVLRAITSYDLRSIICYAPNLAWARSFTATLQAAVGLLEDDQRPVRALRTCHINATSSSAQRATARAMLTDATTIAVVTVVGCFAEGVDVPAVDAVMLCGANRSPTRIIQAIGRALRQGDNPDATAYILVPLYAPPGTNPNDLLDEPDHAAFSRVLAALRSEDDRLAEALATEVTTSSAARASVSRPSVHSWVSVMDPLPVYTDFARAITTTTLTVNADTWWRNFALYEQAIRTHGKVPHDASTVSGGPLHAWGSQQRYYAKRNLLETDQVAAITRMENVRTTKVGTWWARLTQAVIAYQRDHDDLRPPKSHPLWRLLATAREYYPNLPPEQITWLEDHGMVWDIEHVKRSEHLDEIGAFIATHGHLPESGVSAAEDRMVDYLHSIYKAERTGTLHPDHRALCQHHTIPLSPPPRDRRPPDDGYSTTPPAPLPTRTDEVVDWVITALGRGATNHTIAAWLDLSAKRVDARLRAAGHPAMGPMRIDIIAQRVGEGAQLDELAAAFPAASRGCIARIIGAVHHGTELPRRSS